MITPEQIKKKALRRYEAFLRAAVSGERFSPVELPVGKVPKSYPELQKAVTELINSSKAKIGFGYTLELETKNTRKHSTQSIPRRICIENREDYLKLVEKEDTFTNFKADVNLIQETVPKLNLWVQQHPLKVVAHHGSWSDLLKVCCYFQKNPKPNLYIRELPITVHTKFVEENKRVLRGLLEYILPAEYLEPVEGGKHSFEQRFSLCYDEPLLRFRILDPALQQQYGFPITDFGLTVSDFRQLQLGSPQCFVTENLMPFLTMPMAKNSVAIWGQGRAVSLLKSIDWLKDCPIFYYGDMDVDGFKILAQLRSHFPQTQSILMDTATYEAFADFAVTDQKPVVDAPTPLTPAETALYTRLSTEQQRLEQERISQAYVNRFLQNLLA